MMSAQQTHNGVTWTQHLEPPYTWSSAVSLSCDSSTAIRQLWRRAINGIGAVRKPVFFGIDETEFSSKTRYNLDGETMYLRDTIQIIDSLDICGEDHKKIYHGNAAKLIKLNRN